MIVSVTVLGSNDGTAPETVGQRIVEYLEGGLALPAGRAPGKLVSLPAPTGGTAAYYADSAGVRPAQWRLGRHGTVDAAELAAYLAGTDPQSGEALISASGSAGRARRRREHKALPRLDKDWYSTSEVAELLGVGSSYVTRLARMQVQQGSDHVRLDTRGTWELSRTLLVELAADRKAPRVVAGYDVTFSAPKSVSVLWAVADEDTKAAILDALDDAVASGLRYLSRHAISVRVRGNSVPATPVAAAAYLHPTSRALEPQLHHHVVVANAAIGPDGLRRALDARMVFHHAKTASFIAGAELRHQLTGRLGLCWGEIHNGIAEIAGVPDAARLEMSTRAKEIAAATTERAVASSRARQVAAWDTRAAKDHGVDVEALFASWEARLRAVGFTRADAAAVLDQVAAPVLFDEADRAELFSRLCRTDGITEHEAVFDRRSVVQRLAELAGDRLSGDAVDALADDFLDYHQVVALGAPPVGREVVICREDGTVVRLPGGPLYSTEAMIALEQRCLFAYARGRHANLGIVSPEVVAGVLAEERFSYLSDEQRRFVTGLVGSGMQIQAGLGAAGTGKTTALRAAVACWHAAGYRVLGAAVGGTQAVVLNEETGIATRTVASLIARSLEHGDRSLVDARTVVLVDEASLVSTKDFAALAQIVGEAGATLRLVGDPAQHTSVAAGGVFAHLVEHHPDETPTLTTLYRQQGPEMAEVRAAAGELREGKYAQALERLSRDGRIAEPESADAAFEHVVAAWYAERQRRVADPERRRSAMTAEHHVERRELNRRARELLAADGTLSGPELVVGDVCFQAGDEVIARVADRNLRADGAAREEFVRNGSLGRVVNVEADGLVVDFERWGRITVPAAYLGHELPSGHGGLQHAYAVTTHAAQGETYAVSTALVSEQSSPEGLYVAVTRAQHDLRTAVADTAGESMARAEDGLPVLERETSALERTARSLVVEDRPRLALQLLGHLSPANRDKEDVPGITAPVEDLGLHRRPPASKIS
ncbi:MAG: relaxase domain-containing protein [Actinomycetota bacterium]|nr:relaxase domain-containing protein [Actinomycetota bacterium]